MQFEWARPLVHVSVYMLILVPYPLFRNVPWISFFMTGIMHVKCAVRDYGNASTLVLLHMHLVLWLILFDESMFGLNAYNEADLPNAGKTFMNPYDHVKIIQGKIHGKYHASLDILYILLIWNITIIRVWFIAMIPFFSRHVFNIFFSRLPGYDPGLRPMRASAVAAQQSKHSFLFFFMKKYSNSWFVYFFLMF